MNESERRALKALRFNWAPTPDDVWRPPDFHVPELHRDVLQLIMDGVAEAEKTSDSSPVGVAVLGRRGTGKTHLLAAVREQTQSQGGYFFLISLLETSAFWRSTALSILDGLAREDETKATQLKVFLRRLVDLIAAPRVVRRAITGDTEPTRSAMDGFIDLLRKVNPQVGLECQDTARALALRASEVPRLQDIGYEFLCSNDEEERGDRSGWGMKRGKRAAQEIVRDISRLLALTGPSLIAVDQIDLVIAQASKSTEGEVRADWQQSLLIEQIAGGLMSLRETTRRTLSVVACLPFSWQIIQSEATDTVQDRFREAVSLGRIPTAELGRELIEKRFEIRFREADFVPRYSTWPVPPAAFEDAWQFTPRELLRTVDAHVRACIADDEVRELTSLIRVPGEMPVRRTSQTSPSGSTSLLDELDARYAELRADTTRRPAIDQTREDAVVPELINAGLTAWIAEHAPDNEHFAVDPPPGGKPALHARLRKSLSLDTEDEAHWAFRAISAPHAIAALNRIRNAVTAAGLTQGVSKRRLYLLRNDPWSSGTRTREVVDAFTLAGGKTLEFPESDVAQLVALRDLIAERGYETLQPWFLRSRPTESISFLVHALADAAKSTEAGGTVISTVPGPASNTGPIVLGSSLDGSGTVTVELEALRRHTAIFAGSGSGKTVFIRRLVEECALRGVSAIVLDPNNDLARLGDPWPVRPTAWDDAEAARADEYLRGTDVVVWTPLRSGRPLSFRPLPAFADILDDEDAFDAGVSAAVSALAPAAKVDGRTAKAQLGQAVLREALTAYARTGGCDLDAFIELLNDLPEGMSRIDSAGRIGAEMAQLLKAAMVNDKLFGGRGVPVDPSILLTPKPGYRARVSVISLMGLPDGAPRQGFINQLQLALFAWIKRNPAADRPLGGLLVMDEAQTFAPSSRLTPCTQSTLLLASQARKYGLGLVFATQAPKGLHNQIAGNSATQLFGLLTVPAQITAAREIARAKGSDIPDVGRLGRGEFYAAVEGAEFRRIQVPLCLSYHPSSPLSEEEVLDRARCDSPEL